MIDALIHALILSKNQAADDVLLEAMAVGDERERRIALEALIRRGTVRGLGGLIERFDSLHEPTQREILGRIRAFHHALRECGRSDRHELRLAAMKLIAMGHQGKLAYVLSENLHEADPLVSRAAVEAIVALARWCAVATRSLQRGAEEPVAQSPPEESDGIDGGAPPAPVKIYRDLIEQRPEIEAAVARALDIHRGRFGPELLRAGLLLADSIGSKTLAILQTTKHGGQSPMVRRLQQPPTSEHVDAFLLAAAHSQLRGPFGAIFAQIDEAPVLDALLRRTYWLKDHQLQLCMHQVTRGAWWGVSELRHDLTRRTPEAAAQIGDWLVASGLQDGFQDERLEDLLSQAKDCFSARLRLLRLVSGRKRDGSVKLLLALLTDSDERLVRIAARELVRRKPKDYENHLLQLMVSSPESVRLVISRSIGQAGFEQYWQRFDRLEKPTRKQAGRAMMKLLPDAVGRLAKRLTSGPVEQRIKAMQMAQELDLAEPLRDSLVQLCTDPNPRLRSKAVMALGRLAEAPTDLLVERLLHDTDARVRANAIEVLESKHDPRMLTVLAQRARAANSRERANAIKALNAMKVGGLTAQLQNMLQDPRPDHRVSALWALKQVGWWQLVSEVGRLARSDQDQRVRRYALAVLRGVAELAKQQSVKAAS